MEKTALKIDYSRKEVETLLNIELEQDPSGSLKLSEKLFQEFIDWMKDDNVIEDLIQEKIAEFYEEKQNI